MTQPLMDPETAAIMAAGDADAQIHAAAPPPATNQHVVHDIHGSPLLARRQGHPAWMTGAMVTPDRANLNLRGARRELAEAKAELIQSQTRITAAEERLQDLINRYYVTNDDFIQLGDGTIVANTHASRKREPERWKAAALDKKFPPTWSAYLLYEKNRVGGLAIDEGMPFLAGQTDTAFVCHILSPYVGGDAAKGPLGAPRRGAAGAEHFEWANRFGYEPDEPEPTPQWYVGDDGVMRDTVGRRVPNSTEEEQSMVALRSDALRPHPFNERQHWRAISLINKANRSYSRVTFTFDAAFMPTVRDSIIPFLPAGTPTRWCFPQGVPFVELNRRGAEPTDIRELLFKYMEYQVPLDVYVEQHDEAFLQTMEEEGARRREAGAEDRPVNHTPETRYANFIRRRFNDAYPEFAHIESSTSSLVFLIDHVVANDAPQAAPAEPMNQMLGDAFTADYLTTRFMHVPRNKEATCLRDFISPPAKVQLEGLNDESCVYEYIIRTWGASIEAQYAAGQFRAIRTGGRFDYTARPMDLIARADQVARGAPPPGYLGFEDEYEESDDESDEEEEPERPERPIGATIRGALPEITVAHLRAFFEANGVPMRGSRVGLQGLRFFARAFNVKLDVYDAFLALNTEECVAQRDPTHGRVTPRHASIVVKDGHVLPLDITTGLFHQAVEHRQQLESVGAPSAHFHLAKPDDVIVTKIFHLDTLEGLLQLDLASIPKADKRTSIADIRLCEPLERVADLCLSEWRVTPRLRFAPTGRVLISVEVIVDGVILRFRHPKTPGVHQLAISQEATPEYAARLSERRAALRSSLVCAANLSEFNSFGINWWKFGKPSPLVGCLQGVDPKTIAFEADACSAYPSVLEKFVMLPKFNSFDFPELYDGHAFEDLTNYLVRVNDDAQLTVPQMMLLDQTQRRMWGLELKEAWPDIRDVCSITHFFRPFQLVPNTSSTAIRALMTDVELLLPDVKTCMVSCIGELGKKYNKSSDSRVFALEGEARHFAEQHGGGAEVHPYLYNLNREEEGVNSTADRVWVCEPPEYRKELVGNFVPIHDMITSGCRMIMWRTAKRLEAEGFRILAANTDAVFAEGVRVSEPFDKRDPANLGRISFKAKALPTHRKEPLFAQLKWATVPPKVYTPAPVDCTPDMGREDSNGLVKAIKSRGDLLVLGDVPGVGKTTAIIKAFRTLGGGVKHTLAVVHSNVAVAEMRAGEQRVAELRAQGTHACTYAWYLQLFVKNGELVDQTERRRQVYTCPDGTVIQMHEFAFVLLDEAATLPVREWAKLARKIQRMRGRYGKSGPRFCVTADVHQISPIEHNVNPDASEKAHVSRRLAKVFPNYVMLMDPKRWARAECKARVKQLKAILFGNESRDPVQRMREAMALFPSIKLADAPIGSRFIGYMRKTRARLNAFEHGRQHPGVEFPVGVRLVYVGGSKKVEGVTLYKNTTCVIDAVTPSHVKMHDFAEAAAAFEVTIEQARTWFVYSHAATCHAAQGATWDAPVCIADWWFHRATPEWLYVALTRNRDTRDVFILGCPPAPVLPPLDLAILASRIAGHNRADEEKGRLLGDLTVDWVVATHKLQEGMCAICHEEIEMPRVGVVAGLDQVSIDCKRPWEAGHVMANCQLTCRSCNFAKQDN